MRTFEAFRVAKSSNKPIVNVGPSQRRLDGLQCKHEISWSRFAMTSPTLQRRWKTHLEFSRIAYRLGNCSYIRLNVGQWDRLHSRGIRSPTNLDAECAVKCPIE